MYCLSCSSQAAWEEFQAGCTAGEYGRKACQSMPLSDPRGSDCHCRWRANKIDCFSTASLNRSCLYIDGRCMDNRLYFRTRDEALSYYLSATTLWRLWILWQLNRKLLNSQKLSCTWRSVGENINYLTSSACIGCYRSFPRLLCAACLFSVSCSVVPNCDCHITMSGRQAGCTCLPFAISTLWLGSQVPIAWGT